MALSDADKALHDDMQGDIEDVIRWLTAQNVEPDRKLGLIMHGISVLAHAGAGLFNVLAEAQKQPALAHPDAVESVLKAVADRVRETHAAEQAKLN